jgi:peptidyl-lysine (3S)-dioxygenase / protease
MTLTSTQDKQVNSTAVEVERVERPSVEQFQREILPAGRPVVITGVAERWPARRRWTLDFFKSLVGDAEAELRSSDKEAELFFGAFTSKTVRLADYFDDLMRGGSPERSRPYLGNISFNSNPPSPFLQFLRPDFDFPRYFPEQRQLDERIWVAAAGQRSTLHNDNYHNFNAQISGAKRFVLYAPEDYAHLYTEKHNEGCWVSRVDGFAPDLALYPLAARARAYNCTLAAGEILYVPLFWWHQVYAETTAVNINAWVRLPGGPAFWRQ